MPWDENLEGPSLRIAATDDSPLRIRAGPGTGKTFVLIRRIARFLENGVAPRQILVCTFTRTAAGDLKRVLVRQNNAQQFRWGNFEGGETGRDFLAAQSGVHQKGGPA